MGKSRTIQLAFHGGRMAPEMWGRVDDQRRQFGLAELRNMRTTVQGIAERRPGFGYCRAVRNAAAKAVVRPFCYSNDQTMVLVINGADGGGDPGTIEFVTGGQTVQLETSYGDYRPEHTVTFTNGASLEVEVNWTSHPFTSVIDDWNFPVIFTTSGSLPSFDDTMFPGLGEKIVAGRTYYVRPTGNANKFLIARSEDAAGSLQGTLSGSSGTHTVHPVHVTGKVVEHSGDFYYPMEDTYGVEPGVTVGWESIWYLYPDSTFAVPHFYLEDDIASINWVQNGDLMTLVHPDYPPRNLVRRGATEWALEDIDFTAGLLWPTWAATPLTVNYGSYDTITAIATGGAPARITITFGVAHRYSNGDVIYASGISGAGPVDESGFYIVDNKGATTIDLRKPLGDGWANWSTPTAPSGKVFLVTLNTDIENSYKVTAVSAEGVESQAASEQTATCNLNVNGASVTLAWTSVVGAVKYRVYRLVRGIYALIGETDETSFVDKADIGADSGKTIPYQDASFDDTDYPGAVCYHEQRRCFGGTPNYPQTFWMTRTFTESDLSYHQPLLDDDRIKANIATRDVAHIRHLVPIGQTLVALTSSSEVRIAPIDNFALTPSNVSARALSYVGSAKVRPVVVNGAMVFVASRGSHVYELRASQDGFATPSDLTARAVDLVEGATIVDMAHSKTPVPTVWCATSDGRLLGLTYAPDQDVAGWHVHDIDGTVESVTVVSEGNEDILYIVAKRTIDGSDVRYVERMAERYWASNDERKFVDCYATQDGTNTTAITFTLSGGTDYAAGEVVAVTASSAFFTADDYLNGFKWLGAYRILIVSYISSTLVYGYIVDSLDGASVGPSTNWIFARQIISGLDHLEGESVKVLADGAVLGPYTVSGGEITMSVAAFVAHTGLLYESELTTLPLGLQMDGLGAGREKNINRIWARVSKSGDFDVGPYGGVLRSAQMSDDTSGEQRVVIGGKWDHDGQVTIQADDPLPLRVLSLTVEVSTGD